MLNPVQSPFSGIHWIAKLLNGGADLSGHAQETADGLARLLGGVSRRIVDPVGLFKAPL